MEPTELIDPPSRFPRAWPWWAALVALCAVIIAINVFEKAIPGGPVDPAKVDSPILKIYGRYLLGAKRISQWAQSQSPGGPSPFDDPDAVLVQVDAAAPSVMEKIRVVPIAGELTTREEAVERLERAEEALAAEASPDPEYRADIEALRAVYADPPRALEPAERDRLIDRHHWFARLALSYGKPDTDPERAAFAKEGTRTMVGLIAMFLLMLCAGLAGFTLFVIGVIMVASGSLRPALIPAGAPPPTGPTGASNALLESFVMFMAAFLAASLLAAVAHAFTGLDLTFALLLIAPVVALWPMSRGLSWSALRMSLGWHRGRGVMREIGAGIVGYLAGIPVIVLGLVCSVIIIALTGTDATHPIVNEFSGGGAIGIIVLFAMTTLWAPLVEETFFRGALYAHLRGLPMTGARRGVPMALAAFITGLIFAAIHPQGVGGVPVLTALGFNFCVLREWRGSLIAPMIGHALHNGMATVALTVFLM